MLEKRSCMINIQASSTLEGWLPYFKTLEYASSITSEPIINLYLIDSLSSSKFPKSLKTHAYNIFLLFYDTRIPCQKIMKLLPHGILNFMSTSFCKADVEKKLKAFTSELTSTCLILTPDDQIPALDLNDQSPIIAYLHQIAKRITASNETFCILEQNNSAYGLGHFLYLILKKYYLHDITFSQSLYSGSENKTSSEFPRKFVECQNSEFINFIKIYPLAKGAIIYIKNAQSEEYIENHELCKKIILLPRLQEFINGTETFLDLLSHYFLKEKIVLTSKAFTSLKKKSYAFQISDIEHLLQKIVDSKHKIITENIITLFIEGGSKIPNQNFSYYFSQVLTSNAIKWKNGNIYDCGKSFLEKILIKNALEICNDHKKNAAKILGINRNTLREKSTQGV
ncbi:MAG: hypothetical protein A2Y62_14165 [Candidatus Fischerbacteria bacterium RBG_13_37_8]|uniref:DNA binding HTH domain-containing protein n=1 Tax=Candidatus Fischerbacteria bacterium RBG_13_37_8 TaxID=1817863 RepID=A0A1F5VFN0_9BACT|nr:MAG: hypothetical protein A2Y62_14165 [Candidatus Fischerbacteria bacterium RBG_13_37_8]